MKDNKETAQTKGARTLPCIAQWAIAVLAFAAISWIYFYPSDVNGDVLAQHDTLQGIANGQEGVEHEAATGEITRWTDALFGGMPTFQIRPAYSNSGFLATVARTYQLFFPEPVGWIFIMMLGFFILLMAFKVKWYLAVLGAIGYGFSSYFFILVGAGHIWKLLTLAYVPPTIAGLVWCYRGKYLLGAAVAAVFATLQLMSNHVQMSYYFAFVIVAMAVGFLIEAIKEHKIKRWCIATGALAVAAVLAVLANSPNLYMTYKYTPETIRGGHSELTQQADSTRAATATQGGLDKEYITQWSYGKDETFTLMIPNVKGGATIIPEHGENKLLALSDTRAAEKLHDAGKIGMQELQALSQFPQYFGDQPMTNGPVYIGIIIFALALLGVAVVKGPVKWSLVVVSVLALFLSWGHNMMWLTDFFIDYFPMYNKFRAPASMLVVLEFTMPLLAVLALHAMATEDDFWAKHKRTVFLSFGLCALVCIITWLFPSIFGAYSAQETEAYLASGQLQQYPTIDAAIRGVRGAMVSSDALRSLIFLLLGFAVVMAWGMNKIKALPAGLVLALVVLVDMYTVDKRYLNANTFVENDIMAPTGFAPRPVDTQIKNADKGHYRVLDLQHFSEAMPSYFHNTVGGYHAAKLTRYNDLIERQITQNNKQVLDMLNTKYVIINDQQFEPNPQALGNAWFVDTLAYVNSADAEMAFLDHFDASRQAVADAKFQSVLGQAKPKQPGDTIYETSYAPNKLTYKARSAAGGLAVFSEVYFPWGWNITIDGKPAEMGRVNYVLRALPIPAGEHDIEFGFFPTELRTTETLATTSTVVIGLMVVAAIVMAFVPRRRKDEPEPTPEKD